MNRNGVLLKNSGFSRGLVAASCFGAMLIAGLAFSGCNASSNNAQQQEQKDMLKMEVVQVDQLSKLGNKVPDGQYMVAKVLIKNLSNQSMTMNPPDFALQNITEDEKERYSQPAETFMTFPFMQVYGNENKDKLVDAAPMNLYPKLQLERYFVFMVAADAKPNQYQITYKPLKMTAPLVSENTIINDHRNDASTPAPEQQPL